MGEMLGELNAAPPVVVGLKACFLTQGRNFIHANWHPESNPNNTRSRVVWRGQVGACLIVFFFRFYASDSQAPPVAH